MLTVMQSLASRDELLAPPMPARFHVFHRALHPIFPPNPKRQKPG